MLGKIGKIVMGTYIFILTSINLIKPMNDYNAKFIYYEHKFKWTTKYKKIILD